MRGFRYTEFIYMYNFLIYIIHVFKKNDKDLEYCKYTTVYNIKLKHWREIKEITDFLLVKELIVTIIHVDSNVMLFLKNIKICIHNFMSYAFLHVLKLVRRSEN